MTNEQYYWFVKRPQLLRQYCRRAGHAGDGSSPVPPQPIEGYRTVRLSLDESSVIDTKKGSSIVPSAGTYQFKVGDVVELKVTCSSHEKFLKWSDDTYQPVRQLEITEDMPDVYDLCARVVADDTTVLINGSTWKDFDEALNNLNEGDVAEITSSEEVKSLIMLKNSCTLDFCGNKISPGTDNGNLVLNATDSEKTRTYVMKNGEIQSSGLTFLKINYDQPMNIQFDNMVITQTSDQVGEKEQYESTCFKIARNKEVLFKNCTIQNPTESGFLIMQLAGGVPYSDIMFDSTTFNGKIIRFDGSGEMTFNSCSFSNAHNEQINIFLNPPTYGEPFIDVELNDVTVQTPLKITLHYSENSQPEFLGVVNINSGTFEHEVTIVFEKGDKPRHPDCVRINGGKFKCLPAEGDYTLKEGCKFELIDGYWQVVEA